MPYFFRFAIYMGLTSISLFFVWYGLKNYGENQGLSTYQTPLIKELTGATKPIIWSASPQSLFKWTKAYYKDNLWFTDDNQSLEEFLQRDPAQARLLFIDFETPQSVRPLRELIKQKILWKKVIFCSRTDSFLQDLRKLEPEWTFCSGEALMTRLLSLSSIGLGSLVSVRPDVVFFHLKNINLSQNLVSAMQEAKRQNKMVFVGPVSRPMEGYPVDGWVIEN